MSDKDRRKKDGAGKSKERKAMREGPENQGRKAHAEQERPLDQVSKDTTDVVKYKAGRAGDKNLRGAR